MRHFAIKKTITLIMLGAMLPVAACAADNNEERRGPHQGPPPEAIAACKDKSAGDKVTFKGREGESVAAICRSIEGMIVAVPADREPPSENRRQ